MCAVLSGPADACRLRVRFQGSLHLGDNGPTFIAWSLRRTYNVPLAMRPTQDAGDAVLYRAFESGLSLLRCGRLAVWVLLVK